MEKFNNYYDLKNYLLNDLNYQSYNFDRVFDEFQNEIMAAGITSQYDNGIRGNV